MNKDVMFSSKTDQWATPQDFFDQLDAEFHFDLDPCADESNHKTERYFTKEMDGLSQNWGGVEYFVIPRMVEILLNGLRKHFMKEPRITPLLSC